MTKKDYAKFEKVMMDAITGKLASIMVYEKIFSDLNFRILLSACGNNKETRSLSHCADIKFINYANSNPDLFINSSKVILATKERDKKIKKWIKANYNPNALEGMGKVKAKMNDRTDEININLMMEITSLFSEAYDIKMLNDKSIEPSENCKNKS